MQYQYFDAHCDTITKLYNKKTSLKCSNYMVNINHLKNYTNASQVFAIYNDGSLKKNDVLKMIKYFKNECNKYLSDISFVTNTKELQFCLRQGKIAALLSIEALGDEDDFDIDNINLYYKNGISIMGLCHNNDNILCGGIENNSLGLTPLGIKVLRRMQSIGIILDVSHMSDKSFWEAASHWVLPFAATHSNSRSIYPHPRNLSDKQFVYLASKGGICGINFYPPFVNGKNSKIDDVISHIEHFMSLGGENNICLGSDFDGIDFTVTDIDNASFVYRLFDRLLAINYKESLVNKIAFNNFHNFIRKFETSSQKTCKITCNML